MRIVEKHQIDSSGSYLVMEGTVATNKGSEVRLWWVEDQQGNRKSDFTDAGTATCFAQTLSEQEDSDGSGGGHSSDSGDSGGDGGGNGGD